MTPLGFSASDELLLFEAFGLDISLTPDRQRLRIVGPDVVLDAAWPKLTQHRDALIAELQRRQRLADTLNPRSTSDASRTP